MNWDSDKERAEKAIVECAAAFPLAAATLLALCAKEPQESCNLSMRFETQTRDFMFSKSGEKIYYYSISAASYLSAKAPTIFVAIVADDINAGWEELSG